MSLRNEILKSMVAISNKYKEAIQDGKVTIPEVGAVFYSAVNEIVHLTQSMSDTSNEEKKYQAMQALEFFIDTVIVPYDIQSIPNYMESLIDRYGIKPAILSLGEGAIDSAVSLFNEIGWGNPEDYIVSSGIELVASLAEDAKKIHDDESQEDPKDPYGSI